jgi:hypothetical protein
VGCNFKEHSMKIKRTLNIGLILSGLFCLNSCDTNDTKKEEMTLIQRDTVKQIVLRTKGKNISGLNLLIKGKINGAGQLSIGDNDSVAYKTYEVKTGQNEIKYKGDWYSEFCYVTYKPTSETKGQLKIEGDFVGD